ncbi:MAG: hypothetical protein ABIZ52_05835 [Candidatus Limnocylindrales bacterium]
MVQRTLRRIPGLGWEETTPGFGNRRVVRDDGETLVTATDALVGTAEAAEMVGVRRPNFVRDWASRPDFPAPAGTLSSGRVWRASEVSAYRDRRHPPRPTEKRLAGIARRVSWWDTPERTRRRPELFVARVLAHGSLEDIVDVTAAYSPATLRRAVAEAPASLLDAKTRRYWELVLDLPHTPPPPARQFR